MKFAKNALAPLSITASFYISSIVLPFAVVYLIFHPEEYQISFLIIFTTLFFVAAINIIAETVVYLRTRSSAIIFLDDEKLMIEYARKGKSKCYNVKYEDIKQIEFDIGFIPGRYNRSRKFAEPKVNLIGDEHNCILTITDPSLRMIYYLRKKSPSAKISRMVLFNLMLPFVFAMIFTLLLAI